MKSFALLGETALRGCAAAGLALAFASPAFAQTAVAGPPGTPTSDSTAEAPSQASGAATPGITPAAAQGNDGTGPEDDSAIIVTGTRLTAPNLTSSVPINSVSGQAFFNTGQTSVGDVLNELPSLRSTFSTQNSTRFLGTAGLNLLDLRGLGTQRTLVLVNGRRHVGSDILSNGVSPDINTIPVDLIDRADIVTGGDSAIYGSDAIAGVVNFVLKDHYDGVQLRGKSGISNYGDAGSYFGSLLAGKNFANGRGNITVAAEYSRQEDYYGSERPNTFNTNAFLVVDTDPAGSANGSDGVPDRVFIRDVRSATLANGGSVSIASNGACGRDSNSGAAFNCTYLFQRDGSLVPQTGQRIGIGPNGSFIGGNGDNFREGRQLVLQPQQDRYSFNALGHFEVSSAFVPFFEAKYVRINTTGSTSGPAFFQGSTIDANLERPRIDNPFLTSQARTLLTQQFAADINRGVNPNTGAAYATPAAQAAALAALNAGSFRFYLRENLVDLGLRNEASRRETYRFVGGFRGDLGDNWKYEISGNYGEFKEATRVQGNLNVQRFLLAIDAGRNAAGQIVCRSQINPANGAAAENGTTYGDINGLLPADIAACVPLNPFGRGNVSDAARNYLIQDTTSHGKITQAVASGFISGDSSKWFELPAGPIYASVGGEYRRETNKFTADPLVEAGYTFYNAIPTFRAPSFEVKEAYGEIRVPLVKDTFLLQELSVTGAGRVADYKGATGTVYAYNGAVNWSPIRDVHLRGNYSRSVRAPNLSELYAAQGQNFAPVFVDPCSARNIATGSSTRAANCAAAGIPASYDYVYVSSLEIVSGGNPNLKAETSKSYTLGGVFTPSFIPGMSLSVDYYNITVNKVITSVSAQDIANNCYDLTPNNSFCSLFQRNTTATGPSGEVLNQILEGSLLQSSLNFAKLKARGLDTEFSYRHRFDNLELSTKVQYTHVLQRDDFVNPVDPQRADRLVGEPGDPKDQVNWNVDAKLGRFSLGYQMRYISHVFLLTAENVLSIQGRPAENADYADRVHYPAVWYHDIRGSIEVSDRFNVFGGVDNVTNRLPPFGLTGVTDGGGLYDARGRYMYAGVVAKF